MLFRDATFISVRRDSVQKEGLHSIIGMDEEEHKEVLDYALFPSESKENYKEMLQSLKERGLKEVLLFVSDALSGLKDALLEEFPKGRHQACWMHINRNVMKHIRAKDKAEVGDDLRLIHQSINLKAARKNYDKFIEK